MGGRVAVLLGVFAAGCFEPSVDPSLSICDGVGCDGGSGSTGGSTGTGGSGGIVVDGVTYQRDGGLACPNAVTTFATAAECNPSSCSDGCCDGTRCIRTCAQSGGRCGVFAEACQTCSAGDQCDRGSCRGTGACMGCRNTDLCLSGTLPGSCGVNNCNVCESCNNQQCSTPPVRVGDPCSGDGDCSSIGRGAFCRTQTTSGLNYPGGFCTLPCEGTTRACTSTSECVSFPTRFGETQRLCVPLCNQRGDAGAGCRIGYECYPSLGWTGSPVCWISPAPALVGNAPTGSPCLNDADCGTDRRCLRPFLPPRYELNGYFGGYCTGVCTPGVPCGNGADLCTSEPFDTPVGPAIVNACKAPCSAPGFQGECRTDYVCQGAPGGNWCAPRCPARSCTGGSTCDFTTGACR